MLYSSLLHFAGCRTIFCSTFDSTGEPQQPLLISRDHIGRHVWKLIVRETPAACRNNLSSPPLPLLLTARPLSPLTRLTLHPRGIVPSGFSCRCMRSQTRDVLHVGYEVFASHLSGEDSVRRNVIVGLEFVCAGRTGLTWAFCDCCQRCDRCWRESSQKLTFFSRGTVFVEARVLGVSDFHVEV